ncbi:MAG: protein rep [Geitlerinemataceae cyanobacterium]
MGINIHFPKATAHRHPIVCDLSELSPKTKTWDKRKANANIVSNYYTQSHQGEFLNYARRIDRCAEQIEFQWVVRDSEDLVDLKLSKVWFCRVRHCPVCQWRRSLMWKAKAYQIVPKVVADYPKYRWIFLTLTVRNCNIDELRTTLTGMNRAFKRFTELKGWPVKGWVKSVEVTKGRHDRSAHPHLHILGMVMPSYFGRGYFSQAKWGELWQSCLRVDYQPVIHVRAIAKQHDPTVLIPEILKYQVKESDLTGDQEWFLELTRQLHRSRSIEVGGVLKSYWRELAVDIEETIDRERDEAERERLCFVWQPSIQKYKLWRKT